jgi:ABC-2 type transport system permease protein
MIIDALRAETYRLSKNRLTVFWSVGFIPVLFTVIGSVAYLINKANGDPLAAQANLPPMPVSPLNLAETITFTANFGAEAKIVGGMMLVFMLIAGATVYAGDYRWETWRLITPRNDRVSLILGKVGLMKILAFASLLALLLAALLVKGAQAMIYARPVTFEITGAQLGDAALLWVLTYVRIVQYGLIGLLTAVVTRSMMATLFVPLAIGFGQSLLGIPLVMQVLHMKPEGWAAQLLLPGLAYDSLKAAVTPGIVSPPATGDALWPALIGLTLWTVLPLIGALAWFNRQDLSKE